MEFINYTPFPGNAWESVNSDGSWYTTVLIRVKFKLVKAKNPGEWFLQLDPEQGTLFSEDIFYEDHIESSVRYESDYVPYKPSADIVINTKTYSPNNKSQWHCGVVLYSIQDEHSPLNSLMLQIHNKSHEKQDYLNVRYEKCKGGIVKVKNRGKNNEEIIANMYNPIGCGKYPINANGKPCDVEITYYDEALKNTPAGLGFMHRSWKSRLDYAGTYDEQWLEHQHPLPPKDFDYYHNQGAHPMLVCKTYLQAGERIELHNLIKDEERSFFVLPEYKLLAKINTNTQTIYERMNLDTLIVDIYDEETDAFRVYASWRVYTKLNDDITTAEAVLVPHKEKDNG